MTAKKRIPCKPCNGEGIIRGAPPYHIKVPCSICEGSGSVTVKGKGFASMTFEERQRIARMGGKASAASGKAHRWTSAEAKEAGKKGGRTVQQRGTGHKFNSETGKKATEKRWGKK